MATSGISVSCFWSKLFIKLSNPALFVAATIRQVSWASGARKKQLFLTWLGIFDLFGERSSGQGVPMRSMPLLWYLQLEGYLLMHHSAVINGNIYMLSSNINPQADPTSLPRIWDQLFMSLFVKWVVHKMKSSKHMTSTGAPKKKGNVRQIGPWPLMLPSWTPTLQSVYK